MLSKKISTNRSTIFMFFGIIIGLCCGILIRNYQTLEIVKKCKHNPDLNDKNAFDIINIRNDETVHNSQNNLLFVGVMTAKNFLKGRANAVFDTWGKRVPGRIAFFSSEDSFAEGLPVVALKNVDDRYPPQKKSFMMLYYMYKHFIDKFEWFARTDDDVYINTHKLEKFLRSIDSSKPQFIGQAGKGNSEEFGLLSLEFDENFCMGGPGVILSRETLRRVAPHIPTCLKNLYSTHEDVEIGRCVQKFAGIPCTWNYEMQSILHHNSSGRYAFTGNLKSKEIHNAITLHPVKKAPLMYRLHSYMQGLLAQDRRQQILSLHRDIVQMQEFLKMNEKNTNLQSDPLIFSDEPDSKYYLGDQSILGTNPGLKKFKPSDSNDLQYWNFLAKSIYSAEYSNPKRKLESSLRESLEDIITEIMEKINNFSRQRGRVIEFRDLLYGYSRVNNLYGHDVILDLLLIYKKYRGKKMTVPVRRHLYVQRAFTDIFIQEINATQSESHLFPAEKQHLLTDAVKDFWNTGIGKLSDAFTVPVPANNLHQAKEKMESEKIVFVLSLAGRFSTFMRFLNNYEEICLKNGENTELLIVVFQDQTDLKLFDDKIGNLKRKFLNEKINYITLSGNFSRGKALDVAARSSLISNGAILFFIDVDVTFQRETLLRIRKNTIRQKQIYLPIVFSQYDPEKLLKGYQRSYSSNFMANNMISMDNDSGYFRQFGYGICSIYKSDILHPDIDGFNTDINGWGLEDVKFLEKILKIGQKSFSVLLNIVDDNNNNNDIKIQKPLNKLNLCVFRSPDPSLIHVFHPIYCDQNLDESQYNMCIGTKANTLGSYRQIEMTFLSNLTVKQFYLSS